MPSYEAKIVLAKQIMLVVSSGMVLICVKDVLRKVYRAHFEEAASPRPLLLTMRK